MDIFGNNSFDEIVKEFFGNSSVREKNREQFIKGEDEDRVIDFVEDDEKVYLVFEFPGFDEKDIMIAVKGRELEISAQKLKRENVQDYLNQKLGQGLSIRKKLPDFVDSKKMSHTFRNGVLEVVFNKIKGGRESEFRKVRGN
jgi:HSP20 family molecular chaperone IbpA